MWIFTVLIAMTCAQHCATRTVLTAWTVVCAANYTCAWADETFQEHETPLNRNTFSTFSFPPMLQWGPNVWLCHMWRHPHLRLPLSPPCKFPKACFAIDLYFLLTSFTRKRLKLEWALFSQPWNGLPTPFASQRWTLFSSQFQTKRNLSHILSVNAWQDLRCRNTYRQPWVLTRQAALPGYHTLIRADINGHRTQGKQNPTYFKMFLKVSDDVINILDNEGQSEEESHLADEFWI